MNPCDDPGLVQYICRRDTFRPRTRHAARWLNPHSDYALASAYEPRTEEAWQQAHEDGFSFAAVVEAGQIVAMAAVWRCAETIWALAQVSTRDPGRRGKGLAQSVCSFVTKYIIETGHVARLTTSVDNAPMRRAAERIGYQREGFE